MFSHNITGLAIFGVLAFIAYEFHDHLGWWYALPVLAGVAAFFVIQPLVQKKVDQFMRDVREKQKEKRRP